MPDSASPDHSPRDYRDTLFLPRTGFPMKAGLPRREPELLARWESMGLYRRQRDDARGRKKYVLHDGPPYANGHLHIGHALNKILKDVVTRCRQMDGWDSNYVPGWDCHGLPIEWRVEEKYRAAGKDKDSIPVGEFRRECRAFADNWIEVQKEEFRRMGIEGDWETPYTTMSHDAEAAIVAEFIKFVMNGSLYRGARPVMWSIVEQTALAEAEVEYHDHVSPTIWVRFPVRESSGDTLPNDALKDAAVVIWTTTPWTIPGNRAIAFSADLKYGLYRVDGIDDGSGARVGEKIIIADALAEQVREKARINAWTRQGDADPQGLVCAHPLHRQGYEFNVPLHPAEFVTGDVGTGFVHIAPGHGVDDFEFGIRHGIEPPFTVGPDGAYLPGVALFAGRRILTPEGKDGDANASVIDALTVADGLLARGKLSHSYPHSWRSRAPLIFRNTPQWFISMEANDLRKKALAAIDGVQWVPPSGGVRLRNMIQDRPDWVISRQRAWGVPITMFVCRESGDILRDEDVNRRIIDAVGRHGADVWFERPAAEFLGDTHDPAQWEKVEDILDVWFDSGSTHAFVLEQRADLKWPASLYLEGTDQHRGWFHSSLLESCATRGAAPYEAVLTHGFVMDEQGRKMSKSLGNVVDPGKVIESSGADILRLWVMSADYSEDLRIGPDILKATTESYRKIRNTLRFLLGNLNGFDEGEKIPRADMPELERWVLHRLAELDDAVRDGYNRYDFRRTFQEVFNFMTLDLSAFYFDIRKDSLYCDRLMEPRRRACRTVLDEIFHRLVTWLAPMLCFTMEEAWLARFPDETGSVHLLQFPPTPADWRDDDLAGKWRRVRAVRRVITGALEMERQAGRIGSSLEAAPRVHVSDPDALAAMQGLDLAEIAITSQAELCPSAPPADAVRLDDVDGVAVVALKAEGKKCARCWKILPDVGSHPDYPDLAPRDAAVVAEFDAGASAA